MRRYAPLPLSAARIALLSGLLLSGADAAGRPVQAPDPACVGAIEAFNAAPGRFSLMQAQAACGPDSASELALEAQLLAGVGERIASAELAELARRWAATGGQAEAVQVERILRADIPSVILPPEPPVWGCLPGDRAPEDAAVCAEIQTCLEKFRYQKSVLIQVDISISANQFDKKLLDALRVKVTSLRETEAGCAQAAAPAARPEARAAALLVLAAAYTDMAASLDASTRPPHLTPEQLELYEMAMEDKAFPMREKARAALKQAAALLPVEAAGFLEVERRLSLAGELVRQQGRVAALQQNLALYGSAQAPPSPPALPLLKEKVALLETAIRARAACLPPEIAELGAIVLEQARVIIADKEEAMAREVLTFVQEQVDIVTAQPECPGAPAH